MKLRDLLRMSTGSLLKRKLRTVLTVLGVMIGIAAIVTMIALGEGMNRTMLEQIEQYGSLRTVTVQEGGQGGGMSASSSASGDSTETKLTDDTVELIKTLDHVVLVSPVLEFQAIIKTGQYSSNIWGQALTLEALRDKGWKFQAGEMPQEGDELKFLFGNMVQLDFQDSRGTMVYYEKGEIPDVDFMNDVVFTIFDTESYYQSMYGGNEGVVGEEDGSRQAVTMPKKYIIPTAGVLEGAIDEYREYSWSTYCDIEALMNMYKRVFRNKVIPGQPQKSNGGAYRQIFYNSIYVKTDDMNHVSDVQKQITELGYQAYSDAEWIQQMQEENRARSAMLGGIGAVALLVAAIGIANTMMMSIYERTKEIGVMKVLGCDLRDIRALFLIEAAIIGFVGGVIGIVLSYVACLIINFVTKATTAVVPLWLVPVSLLFAVFVGMAAGFVPSGRAMRLSPLAAIRNE